MEGNPLRDIVGLGNNGLEAKIQVDSDDVLIITVKTLKVREIGYMPMICEKATKKPPHCWMSCRQAHLHEPPRLSNVAVFYKSGEESAFA
jgi:hypothetical protein